MLSKGPLLRRKLFESGKPRTALEEGWRTRGFAFIGFNHRQRILERKGGNLGWGKSLLSAGKKGLLFQSNGKRAFSFPNESEERVYHKRPKRPKAAKSSH